MSHLTEGAKEEMPDREFAFPKQRKEPLSDASHVRNAVARFNQVTGVTDAERDEAWRRIERKYFPAWRMTVVAVGEEKVIKDELSPFGLEFQKAQ